MTEDRKVRLNRGLRGIYIDRTEASFIDGQTGRLLYRGYDINDLAEHSTFEEVVHLLLYGDLPNASQLDEFDSELRSWRALPEEIIGVIRLVKNSHPMDVLRTAISALAAFDPEVDDMSVEATLRKGVRLTAQAPQIVTAHHRIRQGLQPVPPSADLSLAANFLYCLFAEKPHPEDAALLDKDFVLHAEHGVNASSFAARVTASTIADLHCAITAGISVLKGPSHGGAAEGVMAMAMEIGSPENAAGYVRDLLAGGGRVMGFGHRVYRTTDPRAKHIKQGTKQLGERKDQPQWFSILEAVSETMEPYARRGVAENVDFWSGAMYYLLDIPEDLFVPIFAIGRIPGWILQFVEQLENNIILRPRLHYVGPDNRQFIPLEER